MRRISAARLKTAYARLQITSLLYTTANHVECGMLNKKARGIFSRFLNSRRVFEEKLTIGSRGLLRTLFFPFLAAFLHLLTAFLHSFLPLLFPLFKLLTLFDG